MISKILLTLALVDSLWLFSTALSCGRVSPDPECLDVFTHTPANLPKCYCTDLCEESLTSLVQTCASNELHADGCGACLICARAQGQRCGGAHNVLGVCAGGLVCKVKIPPGASDPRRAEQEAVGICVDEDDPECPRSTDKVRNKNVNCRPGKTGIIAEALYCPTTLPQPKGSGKRKLPTLIEVLLGARRQESYPNGWDKLCSELETSEKHDYDFLLHCVLRIPE